MSAAPRFRLTPREVSYETIEGEVILIHIGRGTYHSLRGSAAALFPALARGARPEDLCAALVSSYEVAPDEASRAVARFIEALRSEVIIVPDGRGAEAADPGPEASAPAAGDARKPFEEPRIETFTDLQDLILADPIHEVEEEGWPRLTPEARSP